MPKSKSNIVIWTVLFLCLLFLSFNRHSKTIPFTYHSQLWGDKSGYNVYLPATFQYHFDAKQFPKNIDSLTGRGYYFTNDNKVITKYSYGTALMQLPFWGVAYLISGDSYSLINHKSIDFASVVYLILGLYFLFQYCLLFFKKSTSIIITSTVFLCTNLFYYSIFDTGMSHVYSFFLFTLFAYKLHKFQWNSMKLFFVLIALISLLTVIRPINVVFILSYLIYYLIQNKHRWKEIKSFIFQFKVISISIFIFSLICLPQLMYHFYAYNSPFAYSYKNEGFIYLFSPKIDILMFSPANGLFLYFPVLLFLILMTFFKFYNKNEFKFLVLFTIIYIGLYSTWWAYQLGCALGHRAYVDFLVIVAIPLGIVFEKYTKLTAFLIVITAIYNLKISFTFDECYYGATWDWIAFKEFVLTSIK